MWERGRHGGGWLREVGRVAEREACGMVAERGVAHQFETLSPSCICDCRIGLASGLWAYFQRRTSCGLVGEDIENFFDL